MENIALLPIQLKIVVVLTVASALATLLGFITERLKLSPLLGYLLAGYLIGPYSPGFVADLEISEQLAELGVILMMFGVGLHLKWEELFKVKGIAITGALGQTVFSAIISIIFITMLGWEKQAALIIGLSVGIASTITLVRVLSDNKLNMTATGHISLSWLICEDFIAVFALLLLPNLATDQNFADITWVNIFTPFLLITLKFILWTIFLFTLGRRIVVFLLEQIIKIESPELFTLATLAIAFAIALGTVLLTHASIALGAFIGGMIVGQTQLRKQISSNLRPMKDTFVVIFFLSIGMLFNPMAIFDHFVAFIGLLTIILVLKPLIAWLILRSLKYSNQVAVLVSMALAQVGEFSFILAEEGTKLRILPEDGYDIIVACAFISLAINPLLFRILVYKTKAKPR
jgi:monovalent cation:H+ antiporter-2, CPA2 family